MKKMRSQQEYSYWMKRAQIIVILVACAFFLFKGFELLAHVDLHFHSIQWEHEQQQREVREPQVEEWNLQHPDASEAEAKEAESLILQGILLEEA